MASEVKLSKLGEKQGNSAAKGPKEGAEENGMLESNEI